MKVKSPDLVTQYRQFLDRFDAPDLEHSSCLKQYAQALIRDGKGDRGDRKIGGYNSDVQHFWSFTPSQLEEIAEEVLQVASFRKSENRPFTRVFHGKEYDFVSIETLDYDDYHESRRDGAADSFYY